MNRFCREKEDEQLIGEFLWEVRNDRHANTDVEPVIYEQKMTTGSTAPGFLGVYVC